MDIPSSFIGLCYHYIRRENDDPRFKRIMGLSVSEFIKHIDMLSASYDLLSLERVHEFFYGKEAQSSSRKGVFISFDDAVSDHYMAARILADRGIEATFFVPTCIITDNEPANPIILHYAFAAFGVSRFLTSYHNALEEERMMEDEYRVSYEKGRDDPWKVIDTVKGFFKHSFEPKVGRRILLHIYTNLILREIPEAFSLMHLSKKHIHDILSMGHAIGAHSHTHLSLGVSGFSEEDTKKEIIEPRRILEKEFGIPVKTMSYPFSSERDWPTQEWLTSRTNEYDLACNTRAQKNTRESSPYEIGRYTPKLRSGPEALDKALRDILN